MSDTLRIAELGQGAAVPFAGRMFVNFGAEVVKVELPPDGDWTRERPPIVEVNGRSAGALFHYLNAGKRSVALSDEPAKRAQLLDALWAWADAVLIDERFLNIDEVAARLEAKGPRVVTIVTPFGRTGPRAGDPATPATIFAASGESSITPGGLGYEQYPDAPPLTARGQVTEIDGGVIATLITTAALTSVLAGADQPVVNDVSIYEAAVSHNRWLVTNYDRLEWIETRASNSYSYGGLLPCLDGYVMFMAPADRHWEALVEMMGRPEWALDDSFKTYDGRKQGSERIRVGIIEWAATKPKAELMRLGLKYSVPIGPFRDVSEVAACPQLNHRGFYVQYGPDGADARLPGLPDGVARSGVGLAPEFVADADSFVP